MRRPLTLQLLIALSAATTLACSDSPTTPTPPPDPTPITESFTGTLTVNGAVTFAPISITTAGSANVTLQSLSPRFAMRLEDGGDGNYSVGEAAYIGDDPDNPTGSVTVTAWNPATRTIYLDNLSGTLPVGSVLVGRTSGARWTNAEVRSAGVGIALGEWSGTTCSLRLTTDLAGVGGLISGVVQGAGTLCARVYDVGRLEVPTSFSISVTHF
jgi:hypothetical protein